MSCNRATGRSLWKLIALCVSILAASAAMGQIAEPPDQDKVTPGHEHEHMSHMHMMNFPMGEETCGPKYTYADGPQGPANWPSVCSAGKMQSPIDIQSSEKLPLSGILRFSYEPANLDVINDCNQYRILVRLPDNDWLRIRKKPYFLSEIHFRIPGENAVNGKRPRMSVQLAHLSPESVIAMIEVPVVAGKENPAMKAVLEHIPAPGKEAKAPGVQIDPTDFLPADRTFYRVPGSLTVPVCNEGVTWYVMKNPIEFSEAQIQAYTKYYHDTARPLQPANGRPVAESNE